MWLQFSTVSAFHIRLASQDIGCLNPEHLRNNLYERRLRFELWTPAAQREGGVPDLHSLSR